MITRLWRGWTAREDADAYEQFLLTELFPAMRGIPGWSRPPAAFTVAALAMWVISPD